MSRGHSPEELVLVLQLTWNWKNLISPFDLCKPSWVKPSCWSIFLPEGWPEFEWDHKHPPHFHPQTHQTLPPILNHCSKMPSWQPKTYSRVDERLSLHWFHLLPPSPPWAHSCLCHWHTQWVAMLKVAHIFWRSWTMQLHKLHGWRSLSWAELKLISRISLILSPSHHIFQMTCHRSRCQCWFTSLRLKPVRFGGHTLASQQPVAQRIGFQQSHLLGKWSFHLH